MYNSYPIIRPPLLQWKSGLIRMLTSLKGTISVFDYFSTSEILPDKRTGPWWEGHYKKGGHCIPKNKVTWLFIFRRICVNDPWCDKSSIPWEDVRASFLTTQTEATWGQEETSQRSQEVSTMYHFIRCRCYIFQVYGQYGFLGLF